MSKLSRLEQLYEDVTADGDIILDNQGHPKVRCASVKIDDECDGILITESAFEDDDDRFMAVTHEEGHCKDSGFYTIHDTKADRQRKEYRANYWAVQKYVPLDALLGLIDNVDEGRYLTSEEVAECFDVPVRFLEFAVDMYRGRGLL